MRAESEWRFGTQSRPKSAKYPTFNAIILAPLLRIFELLKSDYGGVVKVTPMRGV